MSFQALEYLMWGGWLLVGPIIYTVLYFAGASETAILVMLFVVFLAYATAFLAVQRRAEREKQDGPEKNEDEWDH